MVVWKRTTSDESRPPQITNSLILCKSMAPALYLTHSNFPRDYGVSTNDKFELLQHKAPVVPEENRIQRRWSNPALLNLISSSSVACRPSTQSASSDPRGALLLARSSEERNSSQGIQVLGHLDCLPSSCSGTGNGMITIFFGGS